MNQPVVLITGALTGIGRAAAVAFAKKGAKVVVVGRRDEVGKALVKELRTLGSEAEFINTDVRREHEVRALVDKTVARFGRLDVAVNNAGTEGQVGPITDQTAESYAATFDTNVLGVILSMKHEVRLGANPHRAQRRLARSALEARGCLCKCSQHGVCRFLRKVFHHVIRERHPPNPAGRIPLLRCRRSIATRRSCASNSCATALFSCIDAARALGFMPSARLTPAELQRSSEG
jgi:NAD(P)-dependent dehydrogenase (short-subunit alcohol dehydrogenase family)